jgi:putative two-component system response regulator
MTTVLLVDDDVISLEVLAEALKDEGYEAVAVSDPETAIQTALEIKPDFIIIDIVMPNKSGLELCREFKLNPLTREIPIMFLSSSEDLNHAIASLHLGCVDYLRKPIRASQLSDVIRKHDVIREISKVWQCARRELETILDKYRHEEKRNN